MLIENPDAFKSWLTSVLEPLCDADPEALAKYVFALVKKDKSVELLRQGMLEQLDVFLQAETKPFVELLFKTLETQEYLTPTIPNANPPNPNVPVVLKKEPNLSPVMSKSSDGVLVKDVKPIIPLSTLPNLSESINGNITKKEDGAVQSKRERDRDHRKSDSEKDDRGGGRSGRTRHRSASRNRSRSRSWERNKRSRSPRAERSPRGERSPRPDRADRERRDRSRPWRNKSPPRNRYDRRRSRSGSPVVGRLRSRSRSPRHTYRGRYRNRSPPRSLTRSRSRSNDRLRSDKDKKDARIDGKDLKEENSGGATPTQDSNHGDTDMRLINTTQSIQSVVSALTTEQRTASAQPIQQNVVANNTTTFNTSKRRCRDYDEKGFCMRGEMCPYDHGIDPVVLEDTALSRVLTFGPPGANGAPSVTVDGQPAPPGLLHHPPLLVGAPVRMLQHLGPRPPPPPALHSEYNPSAPGMWQRVGFRGPRPMMVPRLMPLVPFTPLQSKQRELINVPVTDNTEKFQGFKRRANDYQHEGSPDAPAKKKQGFDYNRLGPRTKNPVNCSLELKKIPRGLNNISHLNNHFSKFGKIVNIQVCYEGDPEGAIVTFSSHAEANAAYRSTEAVLNNRFIKVFWHSGSNEAKQENIPPRTVKERLGGPVVAGHVPNTNKVLNLLQTKEGGDETNTEPSVDSNVDKSTSNQNQRVYVPSALRRDSQNSLNNTTSGGGGVSTTTNSNVSNNQTQLAADSKALANAAIFKNQEILAVKEQLKKKHEEKRKEALKITQDLRKRKQELLEKQLAQQKRLIEKLEKTNPAGQQRELLMSTIKTVQESIESIRKELVATPAPGSRTTHTPRKSKEEAQKEVLDAELDLITKQQEGGDTSELQKRLQELRAQALVLSRTSAVGRGTRGRRGRIALPLSRPHHTNTFVRNNLTIDHTRGRSGVRAGRNTYQKHTVVDHRPTRLLVSGYEADESESVLAHFAQYGEITDYVSDDSTPSIVLNYKTRKEAEVAILKGKNFQDRTLSITWCNSSQLNNQRATSRTVLLSESTTEDQLLEGEDENVNIGAELSEEALLQDDEEEDDENEDRSWRR